MLRKQHFFILIISIFLLALPGNVLFSGAAQSLTPALPHVAIHVSELTQALQSMPAGQNTPKPPVYPDASGFEWWYTSWHYFVMAESLQEALGSDGTPYTIVTDADITAGNLLHPDGTPKYPILISLATEAVRDDEVGPLRDYVNAGGFLFVGSSSFTRNPDGTTRGNFALSNEMGLRMVNASLQNLYINSVFTKTAENRLVSHIPYGTLNWHLPLSSEEIPLGTTAGHVVHQDHDAWAVSALDAQVIANGSAGPLVATKAYGDGRFIYYGILQPLIGLGGNDAGMYSYLIFRRAIEWAFESSNLPIVKLSPWRYAYDSAFIVRHDFENDASSIQAIESIAQSEQSKGVKGEYYFCTGTVRVGSEDHQLSDSQKQATIQSLRRAVSLYGAIIGSHNGGLPNPVNPTMPPSSYDYWHWGPDEALDTSPPGYANGKAYANASISRSFQDIEGWLSGLDNGRTGCGSASNCPRTWVSPYFNSGREGSFDVLAQLGAITMGEQKLSPFPHWTLSTQTNGYRYTHLSLPVSDWYVGSEVAQSLEGHSDASMRAGVDFFHDLGFLVNFYGHGSNASYSSYVTSRPRMWSTNSVGIYDWWVLRSPVVVTPTFNQNGNTASVTATISNATDPDTAIELVIPYWSTGSVGNLQVLLDGLVANPADYRTTSYGVKIKVGNSVSIVEVRYDMGIAPPTNTPTPTLPSYGGDTIYLSSTSSGTAGGVSFADEDILAHNVATGTWSMYFDGSDLGLSPIDVDAFALLPDGSILLSFDAAVTVSNLGTVDDSDIVRFTPVTLGASTAGSFTLYFDGSDVGLTTNGEDIDVIDFAPDGRLIIGITDTFSVTGASGGDEDLLAFLPTSLGANTAGTWSLHFDGSDVGLASSASEDTNGLWVDSTNGKIYLSTVGTFSVTGAFGDGADIFICNPGSLGTNTVCTFGPGLYWDGSIDGFAGQVIDGIEILPAVAAGTPTPTATPTLTQLPADTPTITSIPSDTPTKTLTSTVTDTPPETSTPTSAPLPSSTPTDTPPDTSTPTSAPLPTSTPTRTPTPTPSTPITIGETNVLNTDDYGNGNLLIAQQAVLSQNATIQSLSFYVTTASGQLRLGIYDDTGGNPGALKAQTAAFTPVVGWNTQNVSTPALLPAGTYWLAYLPQSNNLHFRVASTGSARGYSYPFGIMPSTYSSSPMSADVHWSFYATLIR